MQNIQAEVFFEPFPHVIFHNLYNNDELHLIWEELNYYTKPGKLLEKPGSGVSPGAGLIVNTPVGPLRLEAANQGFDGEMRFNLGVGWKF